MNLRCIELWSVLFGGLCHGMPSYYLTFTSILAYVCLCCIGLAGLYGIVSWDSIWMRCSLQKCTTCYWIVGLWVVMLYFLELHCIELHCAVFFVFLYFYLLQCSSSVSIARLLLRQWQWRPWLLPRLATSSANTQTFQASRWSTFNIPMSRNINGMTRSNHPMNLQFFKFMSYPCMKLWYIWEAASCVSVPRFAIHSVLRVLAWPRDVQHGISICTGRRRAWLPCKNPWWRRQAMGCQFAIDFHRKCLCCPIKQFHEVTWLEMPQRISDLFHASLPSAGEVEVKPAPLPKYAEQFVEAHCLMISLCKFEGMQWIAMVWLTASIGVFILCGVYMATSRRESRRCCTFIFAWRRCPLHWRCDFLLMKRR